MAQKSFQGLTLDEPILQAVDYLVEYFTGTKQSLTSAKCNRVVVDTKWEGIDNTETKFECNVTTFDDRSQVLEIKSSEKDIKSFFLVKMPNGAVVPFKMMC